MIAGKGMVSEFLLEIGVIARRGGTVSGRISDPSVEFGLFPTCAADAQFNSRRKRSFPHFAVDSRAGQARAVENSLEANDAIWFRHSYGSIC